MWSDEDTQELLSVRGEEEIMRQMTGTVRDASVYHNITKILAIRGIKRSQATGHQQAEVSAQEVYVHDHNKRMPKGWSGSTTMLATTYLAIVPLPLQLVCHHHWVLKDLRQRDAAIIVQNHRC